MIKLNRQCFGLFGTSDFAKACIMLPVIIVIVGAAYGILYSYFWTIAQVAERNGATIAIIFALLVIIEGVIIANIEWDYFDNCQEDK